LSKTLLFWEKVVVIAGILSAQSVFATIDAALQMQLGNNQFRFTVNGWTGTNYVVQATTNLTTTNWISLTTNAAPFLFTQTNASLFSQRFYRAKIWP